MCIFFYVDKTNWVWLATEHKHITSMNLHRKTINNPNYLSIKELIGVKCNNTSSATKKINLPIFRTILIFLFYTRNVSLEKINFTQY